MSVDGEERRFGRRGGGPGDGAVSIPQVVEFDEGVSRTPHGATARWSRPRPAPGRDGTPREVQVEGALAGKSIVFGVDDQGRTALVAIGQDQRTEVPAEIGTGVASRVDLSVFVPARDAKNGSEVADAPAVRGALRGLFHPVRAESRRGGGFGGRGRRGGIRSADRLAEWIAAIDADGGTLSGSAKLGATAKQDGRDVANVRFTIEIAVQGTPADLGLGGFGGRGFGGRGSGGPPDDGDTGKATGTVKLEGSARVDVGTGRVEHLEVTGALELSGSSKRTIERDGESSDLEMHVATTGTLHLAVDVR